MSRVPTPTQNKQNLLRCCCFQKPRDLHQIFIVSPVQLVGQKVVGRDAELLTNRDENGQTGCFGAAFDLPQIGGVDVALLRQFFAGESLFFACGVDSSSQCEFVHVFLRV